MPQTQLVNVCDREADFFELFDEQRKNPGVDLLIRAKFNRRLEEEKAYLFDTVRQAPPLSQIRVSVPRKSARPKKSKQKARPKQPARMADLSIRSK